MDAENNLIQPSTKKPTMIRYRFSVPQKDVSVVEWIQNQSNVSQSIRELIKNQIKKTGYDDVTCQEVHKLGPVGRPVSPKKSVESETAEQTMVVPSESKPVVQAQPQQVSTQTSVDDSKMNDMLASMF